MKKVAIIDLGTNTFNMLVAEENGRAIYKEKIPVKLGKGGISKGEITPDAYNRAISTMSYFKEKLLEFDVDRTVAIATSAMRNAKNSKELTQDIYNKTGIKIQVISGEEEAELIYFGVRKALDLGKEPSLIIDIGGGSVEFIIGNNEEIFWKESFEIGAQRLLDLFHKNDPITSYETNALNTFLEEKLSSLFAVSEEFQPKTLVGSSGAFDTLAEINIINNNLPIPYDDDTEYTLLLDDFNTISEEIISKNREQRMQIPGMIEMRVEMIVVACLLIKHVLEKIKIKNLRISSYALKEGVLYKTLYC